ncbi:MAG: ComEC/Rec2 family competence protein [Bacteroidales bacterium]|nr:ComEC/Rec2 family competence protein [Bacteroidales bacterium]
MAEEKSIESLSLFFTAGAAAGTLLAGPSAGAIAAVLLPLAALPFFLREKLLKTNAKAIGALFCATFLVLGMFCALSASMIPERGIPALMESAAERLKNIIGGIPFRSPDTAPLLQALFTGDRSALSPELTQAFRRSGASHILALSGLHMGIIYMVFDRLSRVLGRSPAARYVRFAAMILAAGFFTIMTGASPSIVRAFLFILINEVLTLTGRPRKAVRVLCLALLVQLVLQPEVISTLGFQLSYLAMGGIFILSPVMDKWYPEGRSPLRWVWKSAALGISCQVFTAPLVWLRFHTFPRYFLLTNLMALPLTTLLMTSALITIALAAAGMAPEVLVRFTDWTCSLLTGTLGIIASLP